MVKELTVFFPMFNDEHTIEKLVTETIGVLEPLHIDYEILVIDDCSRDNSVLVAKALAVRYPRVRLIQHQKNQDYGGVLRTGFSQASKAWIFYTDGDGQYDVKELPALLTYAGQYDFVNGNIADRNDALYRKCASIIYQKLLDICCGKTIAYVNCDFRVIKKTALQAFALRSRSGFAPAELVVRLKRSGVMAKEVMIQHFPRQYGRSQFLSCKKIVAILRDFALFMLLR
jgi:glycosyltransferase involved in cell wall biosynthesis